MRTQNHPAGFRRKGIYCRQKAPAKTRLAAEKAPENARQHSAYMLQG